MEVRKWKSERQVENHKSRMEENGKSERHVKNQKITKGNFFALIIQSHKHFLWAYSRGEGLYS